MNLRDLFRVVSKLKKVNSRTATKPIPLLQPEHRFCQQNAPECGQVQDSHPNEKMGVSLYLNGDVVLWDV